MVLGQEVSVKAIMVRNGRKPRINSKSRDRYARVAFGNTKKAIWIGRRSIYLEGYTEVDVDEGYLFVPYKTARVNLVALSQKQTAYVMDEDMSEV